MAVEATAASDRQMVEITWSMDVLTGELVQLYCVNPENGDVSNSGLSGNDGKGYVSYPQGYSGSSEITVYDNHGNADFGLVTIDGGSITTDPDAHPEHPIVLPPDANLHPEHPIVLPGEPTHPIVLPPDGIWPNPPEGSVLPEHPIAPGGEPPSIWPSPGLPTHPIVIPPILDDDFWTGNLPPSSQPV